ncbi:GNAT family N-acetyltransferase [Oryzomicrobium sp.]|uniref:GNAT family N-acetyltransferase n=1 Tax=Oryzomicrobium sp. TaxID=1911578 RepID=UPI002FE07FA3
MEPVAIRLCTVADLEASPCLGALLDEYAQESAIEGLPHPSAQMPFYRQSEAAGVLSCLGAYRGADLIGFLLILAPVLPHYGVRMAAAESFFVAGQARKSGAGLKLLRAAEAHAKTLGAPGLLVSAPSGGRLADVLPGVGYRETNRVFFRALP